MKTNLLILASLLLLIVASENNNDPENSYEDLDMTEKLVGDYTYTEKYTISVNGIKTEGEDSGSFSLVKNTSLMLEMTGDLLSSTVIVNYNLISFLEKKVETALFDGYYYYGSGKISGDTITFSYRKRGTDYSQSTHGFLYEKVSTVTARKVKKK